MVLSGEIRFINNSGGDESTLHMQSFSQAVLNRGLSITFEGNSGRLGIYMSCIIEILMALCHHYRFGASILIDSITALHVYSRLAANPHCNFIYDDEDMHLPPQNWTNVCMCKYILYDKVY